MAVKDPRPFFLNLIKIRLPIPGVVSIFHRVSGIFLFLAIPFYVYVLDVSLQGAQGFQQSAELLSQPFSKLVLLILLWSLVHHFFAGIRFLLTDFDIGLDKASSKKTAWMVMLAETLVIILVLIGVCS